MLAGGRRWLCPTGQGNAGKRGRIPHLFGCCIVRARPAAVPPALRYVPGGQSRGSIRAGARLGAAQRPSAPAPANRTPRLGGAPATARQPCHLFLRVDSVLKRWRGNGDEYMSAAAHSVPPVLHLIRPSPVAASPRVGQPATTELLSSAAARPDRRPPSPSVGPSVRSARDAPRRRHGAIKLRHRRHHHRPVRHPGRRVLWHLEAGAHGEAGPQRHLGDERDERIERDSRRLTPLADAARRRRSTTTDAAGRAHRRLLRGPRRWVSTGRICRGTSKIGATSIWGRHVLGDDN
ncbi:hypothetical protein TCAP_06709 [Tolypocladium capitatum]|uniref:Uncharacterized protein n=1 Tax=Tolypocladium capitatum TaxID=45235 RepID=A0A2K3Q6Z4_9HYPO|nr:hypothetical protein TCAP_06709 [Tolypocladium capitatum]